MQAEKTAVSPLELCRYLKGPGCGIFLFIFDDQKPAVLFENSRGLFQAELCSFKVVEGVDTEGGIKAFIGKVELCGIGHVKRKGGIERDGGHLFSVDIAELEIDIDMLKQFKG